MDSKSLLVTLNLLFGGVGDLDNECDIIEFEILFIICLNGIHSIYLAQSS